MIPICNEQTLLVKDKAGREFRLKYLTELDNQVKYLELTKQQEEGIEKQMDKARIALPVATEDDVRGQAYVLYKEEQRTDVRAYMSMFDAYIDIFVAGWSGKGIFPFPSSGRPSAALKLYEKFPLYRMIQDNIGELTGLSEADIKN
jgi:hypothetical protein